MYLVFSKALKIIMEFRKINSGLKGFFSALLDTRLRRNINIFITLKEFSDKYRIKYYIGDICKNEKKFSGFCLIKFIF